MKDIGIAMALAGWLMLGVFIFTGCEEEPAPPIVVKPVPSGYELTTTGSGCREIASGQYVDRSKCDPS